MSGAVIRKQGPGLSRETRGHALVTAGNTRSVQRVWAARATPVWNQNV